MVRNRVHHLAGHAFALDGVDLRADDLRPRLIGAEQLQTLGGAVRALVILARQIFHCEQMCVHLRQVFIIEHVGIGFGEDNAARAFKRRVGKPFDVVTLEKTHAGDRVRPQSLAKLLVVFPNIDKKTHAVVSYFRTIPNVKEGGDALCPRLLCA